MSRYSLPNLSPCTRERELGEVGAEQSEAQLPSWFMSAKIRDCPTSEGWYPGIKKHHALKKNLKNLKKIATKGLDTSLRW